MTRIALIGFMGSGKTTAARAAAEALKAQAIDVDAELERTFGRSIERVFDEEGEQVFRAREEELTLESLARPNAPVVALGGGATGSAGGWITPEWTAHSGSPEGRNSPEPAPPHFRTVCPFGLSLTTSSCRVSVA